MTRPKRPRSARNAAASPSKPEPETYQVGEWAGIPNYGCPFCPFRTLDGASTGTALVVAHIATDHRQQAIQASQEA